MLFFKNLWSKTKNLFGRTSNGTVIQSKYRKTGIDCVNECFANGGNGEFLYWANGQPMPIEVPSDKYDDAVCAMEEKIRRGQVKKVTDPAQAKNIIRKGHFTYEQVKNMAIAGKVEAITFNKVKDVIFTDCKYGVSSILTYAVSIWGGQDVNVSLKTAASVGLNVSGKDFVKTILSHPLKKAGLNSAALVGGTEAVVKVMGPKASAILVNAFRGGANIYGAAAMKSAAKLLRGNVITGAVMVGAMSTFDVVSLVRGRISGKQLFKNITNTGASVAGGSAGALGGAAIGSVIFPGIGTLVGGIVGGVVASYGTGKVSNAVLGAFIEDDADEMQRIIERVFQQITEDYLLNQTEAEHIVENLSVKLTGKTLKDMFEESNRERFARELLMNSGVEMEVSNRQYIKLPSDKELAAGLKDALEEIADEEQAA